VADRITPSVETIASSTRCKSALDKRGRVDLGTVPGDHAALLHPLQPGLHGAAGDAAGRRAGRASFLHPDQLLRGNVELGKLDKWVDFY